MSVAGVLARVEPVSGALPVLTWRWDDETSILSGAFKASRKHAGLTGSVELADAGGAIVVLDVSNGMICGLDVVIWPAIEESSEIGGPREAEPGRVIVPVPGNRAGLTSLEFDTELAVTANPETRLLHVHVGPARDATPVRVADKMLIEVDEHGALAGFWLERAPAWPAPLG